MLRLQNSTSPYAYSVIGADTLSLSNFSLYFFGAATTPLSIYSITHFYAHSNTCAQILTRVINFSAWKTRKLTAAAALTFSATRASKQIVKLFLPFNYGKKRKRRACRKIKRRKACKNRQNRICGNIPAGMRIPQNQTPPAEKNRKKLIP
jgi:hypothetical protein